MFLLGYPRGNFGSTFDSLGVPLDHFVDTLGSLWGYSWIFFRVNLRLLREHFWYSRNTIKVFGENF